MSYKTGLGFVCISVSLQVAAAAPIQYSFSFLGSGTLNGSPFTGQTVTLAFQSDTSQISNPSTGLFETPGGIAGTYSIAGVSAGSITTNVFVFDNQNAHDTGFYLTAVSHDFFDVFNASFGGYDLTSAIGPINAGMPILTSPSVATNNGQLVITSASNLMFTATLTSTTPEPATYLMLGTAIAGLALWRRRVRN